MGKSAKGINIYFIIIVILLLVTVWVSTIKEKGDQYTKGEFVSQLEEGQVTAVEIQPNSQVPTGTLTITLAGGTIRTLHVSDVVEIENLLEQYNIDPMVDDVPQENWFLSYMLPILLVVIFCVFMFVMINAQNANNSGGGKMMNFGKSRARLSTGGDITLKDVAGLEEEKEDLEEIVDFLKDPGKYTKVGARIPKGVLLEGAPGTGKTLLAKAIAGEAKVPFFSISGSDFVEMFVGVGASRVRDLFADAKKNSPCIVFIDEIDAVARRRGTGMGGGHDEREQTLNQLLVEMDGFGTNEGIIVMAATNRVDILDPAILRPGRFDRKITVAPPDVKGREEILNVHAKNKPLSDDVDLKQIAQTTAGFTGAELENLLNEAAIMAAKDRRRFVRQSDIKSAFIKVGIGAEKRSKVISDKEKRITAYHETGHAILFHMLPDMEAVYTISIIPTGPGAAGYTMPQPENDDMFQTRGKMMQYITVCLGGRVAEDLVFHSITTGASNDIEQATKVARSMITRFGMNEEFGMVAFETVTNQYLGGDTSLACSESTAAQIDEKVVAAVRKQYDKAEQLLKDNMPKLHELAKYLYEKETITGDEFMEILNLSPDQLTTTRMETN